MPQGTKTQPWKAVWPSTKPVEGAGYKATHKHPGINAIYGYNDEDEGATEKEKEEKQDGIRKGAAAQHQNVGLL